VLSHPPHSPDLDPSNFQLFGAEQDAIFRKRFGIVDEVNEEVKKCPQVQHCNVVQVGEDAAGSRWRKGLLN
jgi:hypothetical protein